MNDFGTSTPPSPFLPMLRALNDIADETEQRYDTLWWREEHVDLHALVTIAMAIRDARADLADVLKRVEKDIYQAMGNREVAVDGIGVVTCRKSVRRTQWRHDELWPHVVARIVEEPGVVCDEDGEVLPPWGIAEQVARRLREVCSPSWKVTGLRKLGVDGDEFCTVEQDGWSVSLPGRKQ